MNAGGEPDGSVARGEGDAFLGVERSLGGRRWRLREADDRLAAALSQRLSLPEVVGRVLAGRGVGLEEAESYLDPTLRDFLPDPSSFRDMDAAANRLARAVMEGELVAVFGDYDVDGATSSALLKGFLTAVGGRVRVYIPDRVAEGYGPNRAAFEMLRDEGARVVVTVDCGTTAFDVLEQAVRDGLDVIVLDHHEAEPRLPKAVAVVNPNRLDESGRYGHLAAVGVTFLAAIATNRALRRAGWFGTARREPDLMQWLDLVALGTVCDVVPLSTLNRALVCQGLKIVGRRTNVGLAALADVARLNEKPGTYHLGYILGPRVNAGGRVGRADLGTRLLSTFDPVEATEIARQLDGFNSERQTIEAAVLEEAVAQVENAFAAAERVRANAVAPLVMAAAEGWHPGVIGIVASRLKERYNRPAFVVALDQGVGKGSARSISGVDLGAAVIAARQAGLLINGGGHRMAAGFTVAADRLTELTEFLSDRLADAVAEQGPVPTLTLDGALAPGGATLGLVAALEKAGPFGAGNAEPRFAVTGAQVVRADVVGQGHVRCILTGPGGGRLKAIAFRALDTALGTALLRHDGQAFHVAGHLRFDRWNGAEGVQLLIDDAAPARSAR